MNLATLNQLNTTLEVRRLEKKTIKILTDTVLQTKNIICRLIRSTDK